MRFGLDTLVWSRAARRRAGGWATNNPRDDARVVVARAASWHVTPSLGITLLYLETFGTGTR